MTPAISAPVPPAIQLHPLEGGAPPPQLATPADLLPLPADVDRAQVQDALSMLYLLISSRASADMLSAQNQIGANQTAKAEAFKEQLEALRRAAEASGEGSKGFFESFTDLFVDTVVNLATFDLEGAVVDPLSDLEEMWNSPRFWQDLSAGAGTIAQIALVVGGIAATAATCGAAGPLVAGIALALSAGGVAIQETDCLDGVLGKGVSDYFGAGMQLAAGAVCFAAASGSAASWVNTVSNAVNAGGGAATVVTAGAGIRVAKFEGDVFDAEADGLAAQKMSERMTRLIEWLIDGIQATDESHKRAKETLGEVIQQSDQAQAAAIFTSGRQLS
ncbi:MAG: hypothetical protein ABW133_13985 [Polyangiaceae bacterium]